MDVLNPDETKPRPRGGDGGELDPGDRKPARVWLGAVLLLMLGAWVLLARLNPPGAEFLIPIAAWCTLRLACAFILTSALGFEGWPRNPVAAASTLLSAAIVTAHAAALGLGLVAPLTLIGFALLEHYVGGRAYPPGNGSRSIPLLRFALLLLAGCGLGTTLGVCATR
jgi:hypothetical protein